MLIKVELIDGEVTAVFQEGLDRLLEKNLVKRFKRKSGWANVGIDPIRSKFSYEKRINGLERRCLDHENRLLH